MFMSAETYLSRITQTLEHVIAPEIESDYARGQVFAVINLIDQLARRIEYKSELISREIEAGFRTVSSIVRALEPRTDIPEDLASFAGGEPPSGKDIAARDAVDEMLCRAIELYFACKDNIEGEASKEVDEVIRAHITGLATRDLGLLKPPDFSKISRSSKKP